MSRLWRMMLFLAVFCLLLAANQAGVAEEEEGEAIEDPDDEEEEQLTSEQISGLHKKMDKDSNNKVSMAEILVFSDEMKKLIANKDIGSVLEEMDKNGDGKLSMAELIEDMEKGSDEGDDNGETEDLKKEIAAQKLLEQEKFKVADANNDGILDAEELPGLFYPETHDGVLELTAKHALNSKDGNGDGKLTQREFWEGSAAGETEKMEDEELAISDEEIADFTKLDKDKDGTLSVSEIKAWESGRFHTEQAMMKLFELADKDKDDHVTIAELEAAKEALQGSDAHYQLLEWAEHNEL